MGSQTFFRRLDIHPDVRCVMSAGWIRRKDNILICTGETKPVDGDETIGVFADEESVVGGGFVQRGNHSLDSGDNAPLSRECHCGASAMKFPLNIVKPSPQVDAGYHHGTAQYQGGLSTARISVSAASANPITKAVSPRNLILFICVSSYGRSLGRVRGLGASDPIIDVILLF